MVMHEEPQVLASHPVRRASFRVSAWVLAGLGAVAAAVGAVILFAGDDEYVGLGGPTTSWRVGDLSPAWGYGLIAAGVVAVAVAVALGLNSRSTAGEHAAQPASPWADWFLHATIFLVVNAFLWIQDIALGDGLNYAYWATIPWAIGLTAHAFACYTGQRETERRRG